MGRTQYGSFAEFYRRGPHAPFVKEIREPSGAPVALIRRRHPPGHYPDAAVPDIVLQINSGPGLILSSWDLGTGRQSGVVPVGHAVLAPAHLDCDYKPDTSIEVFMVGIPLSACLRLLSPAASEFTGDFGGLHGPSFHDPFIVALAQRMWIEAAEDNPRGRLFLDGAVLALMTALLAKSEGVSQQASRARPVRGGLAPWQIKRVTDYLEADLARDVTLQELAAIAGLSSYHFCRAFRQSTGLPPHRWRTARRMDSARQMLERTSLPITEIAATVGYDDPGRLARAFRKHFGTSPSQYRRQRKE